MIQCESAGELAVTDAEAGEKEGGNVKDGRKCGAASTY